MAICPSSANTPASAPTPSGTPPTDEALERLRVVRGDVVSAACSFVHRHRASCTADLLSAVERLNRTVYPTKPETYEQHRATQVARLVRNAAVEINVVQDDHEAERFKKLLMDAAYWLDRMANRGA